MTWSGKTRAKNAQKIALKDFKNTVTLITKILQAADNKLDEMSCQKAITYKVLKYAYRKKPIEVVNQQPEQSKGSADIAGASSKDANGATQNRQQHTVLSQPPLNFVTQQPEQSTGSADIAGASSKDANGATQNRQRQIMMVSTVPPQHTVLSQPPPNFAQYHQYPSWPNVPFNSWQS